MVSINGNSETKSCVVSLSISVAVMTLFPASILKFMLFACSGGCFNCRLGQGPAGRAIAGATSRVVEGHQQSEREKQQSCYHGFLLSTGGHLRAQPYRRYCSSLTCSIQSTFLPF